jgi:hypothetical protein
MRYEPRSISGFEPLFPEPFRRGAFRLRRALKEQEVSEVQTAAAKLAWPPPEEDEDFDIEQTIRDIHTELADLNKEAAVLSAKIQENFEELGI